MSTDERSIRDRLALWHRATADGDVDTVLGLMAEDVVFLVPGQPPMRGRAAFEQGLRGVLKTHRIESSGDIQEVVVSGDLAYAWSMLTVRMQPLAGGQDIVRRGHALSVLHKGAQGWQVVRDANLLGPAD